MNNKSLLLLIVLLFNTGLNASQPPVQLPSVQLIVASPTQSMPVETVGKNLTAAKDNILNGCTSFILAFSRLAREGSKSFSDTGKAFADHYWLLGSGLVALGTLYFWVYPKVSMHIQFRHPDERNNRR